MKLLYDVREKLFQLSTQDNDKDHQNCYAGINKDGAYYTGTIDSIALDLNNDIVIGITVDESTKQDAPVKAEEKLDPFLGVSELMTEMDFYMESLSKLFDDSSEFKIDSFRYFSPTPGRKTGEVNASVFSDGHIFKLRSYGKEWIICSVKPLPILKL